MTRVFATAWAHGLAVLAAALLALLPAMNGAALAQEAQSGAPDWASSIDRAVDSTQQYGEAAKNAVEGAEHSPLGTFIAKIPEADNPTAIDRLVKNLRGDNGILAKAQKGLKSLTGAMTTWTILRHLYNHEYKKASEDFAAAVIAYGVDKGVSVIVELLCTAVTVGAGAIACFIGAQVIGGYIGGKLSQSAGDWIGAAVYCHFRPQDKDCRTEAAGSAGPDPGTKIGAKEAVGPIEPVGPGSGVGAVAGPGSPGRAGGARVGSVRTNVSASNITTTATNGGVAETTIGAVTGGSAVTSVVTGNITTTGNGRSAKTDIAPNGGIVVNGGPIVNQGGTLVEGGNSMFSRDGRPCLDIYQALCMIQIYPKPAHHPCLPRYLYKPFTNMCELPADYDHRITQPGF